MNKEGHNSSLFDRVMTIIITAICLVTAFFIIMNILKPEEKTLSIQMDANDETVVNVSVEDAQYSSLTSYTQLYGDIVSCEEPVDIYADVSGKVTSVLVSKGDMVEKGQTIAYVSQNKAGYSYQDSPVVSTVSGEVLTLNVAQGDNITTAEAVAGILTDSGLKIQTEVPERYIAVLEEGNTSPFTVRSYPEKVYEGRLSYIAPVVDTSTRTVEIELSVEGDDDGLMPGMAATVSLAVESVSDVILLPLSAVNEDDSGNYVYVVTGGISEKRYVETGLDDGERIAIFSGLNEGEPVVVSGSVSDGASVQIVEV